jgi:hypothetical protein
VLGRDCCGVENVKEAGGRERFGRHQHLPPSCLFYLHSEALLGAQHRRGKTAGYDDLDNLGVFAPVAVIQEIEFIFEYFSNIEFISGSISEL